MSDESRTIAAIATAPGGAVGMVRLSGGESRALLSRVFRPKNPRKDLAAMPGYTGCLGRVFDAEGDIDEAVAFVYSAPRSYTGEDCAEITCHGGRFILQKVLDALISAGASPAAPGEFTRRALLNGKLDLTEAESVADLVSSENRQSLRAALSARDGALHRSIDGVVQELLDASAHIAAWIDYPEEDVDEVLFPALEKSLTDARGRLTALVSGYRGGVLLRDGVSTAIIGAVNVGKSTLMNLLTGEQKSIVTDVPGTTRDVVQERVSLGGVTLNLCDTAGLRDTSDAVEKIGVRRSLAALERCDLILAVFDGSRALIPDDLSLLERLSGRLAVGVVNKTDLAQRLTPGDLGAIRRHTCEVVELSAATGEGKRALSDAVCRAVGLQDLDPSAALLANARQLDCCVRAVKSLDEALSAVGFGQTADAVSVCVEEALDALLELTGRRASDEIIDRVFETFCVGK